GGSRPARTRRVLSRKAGAKSWRSQLSSKRRTSYVSRTSTTRSPSRASRSAASSAVVGAPPTALPRASRKPRSVGSIERQSMRTTAAPRPRASPVKASRSVDLPTPARPDTKTTNRPPSSSVRSRAALSAARPTIFADRSRTSSRIVRLIPGSLLATESKSPLSGRHLRQPARHVRRILEHVEVHGGDVREVRVGRDRRKELALAELLHRLAARPRVDTPVGVRSAVREPDLRDQPRHVRERRRELVADPAVIGLAQILQAELDDLDVHLASFLDGGIAPRRRL